MAHIVRASKIIKLDKSRNDITPGNEFFHNSHILFIVQWVEDQKKVHQDDKWEEQVLPGHDLTPRQLFWVSYGQLWCQKFRDDALRNTIKTGTHTPGEYRVLAPLSNSPDFAKDFNCPIGSPMNPEKKCEVW